MKCACCGNPYWGVKKTKGHVAGRKPLVKSYYVCAGRTKCGASVCPHPAHVGAEDLAAWVLGQLQQMVRADERGTEAAIEAVVQGLREQGGATDVGPLERELEQLAANIDGLITGLDPANLSLINQRLTIRRRRKEFLQEQIRAAVLPRGDRDRSRDQDGRDVRQSVLGPLRCRRRTPKTRRPAGGRVAGCANRGHRVV